MAALVELEMHRLGKQRGAHKCQRKAATFTGAWVLPPAFDVINNVVLIL